MKMDKASHWWRPLDQGGSPLLGTAAEEELVKEKATRNDDQQPPPLLDRLKALKVSETDYTYGTIVR